MSMFIEPRQPTALELFTQTFVPAHQRQQQFKQQQQLQKLKLLSKSQAPLTPYQEISTAQRNKDLELKNTNAITKQFETLADPIKSGVIDQMDVPILSKEANDLNKSGVNAQEAVYKTMEDYSNQKELLTELKIPKYKTNNSDKTKDDIAKYLKDQNIKNPNLINKYLKIKAYPLKARQDILQKTYAKNDKQESVKATKAKVKFNEQNQSHIKRRNEILKASEGDREEANKILNREFE